MKYHQIAALNSLSIQLYINLLQICDEDGNVIANEFVDDTKDGEHEQKYDNDKIDFKYGDYEWKIDDNKLMKKLKKPKQFESFSVDGFMMNGFNFLLQSSILEI